MSSISESSERTQIEISKSLNIAKEIYITVAKYKEDSNNDLKTVRETQPSMNERGQNAIVQIFDTRRVKQIN